MSFQLFGETGLSLAVLNISAILLKSWFYHALMEKKTSRKLECLNIVVSPLPTKKLIDVNVRKKTVWALKYTFLRQKPAEAHTIGRV